MAHKGFYNRPKGFYNRPIGRAPPLKATVAYVKILLQLLYRLQRFPFCCCQA
jgi:hypothetical protein